MGRSHRITLGYTRDAREGAAFCIPDYRALTRMICAIDHPAVEERRHTIIAAALKRLSKSDRAFAAHVLDGMTWRTSGMTKRGFNKRLKKICEKVISPA